MLLDRQERERQQLGEERDAIVARLQVEKEDTSSKLSAEIQQLRADVAGVQRNRDQQLLAAGTEHQAVSQSGILWAGVVTRGPTGTSVFGPK